MNILYYKKEERLKITPDKEVHRNLYFLKAVVPKKKHISDYLKKKDINKTIRGFFKDKTLDDAIEQIRVHISKINYKVPLYDEYTRNLYIIDRDNVYNRVVRQYYRFPNEQMVEMFEEREKSLKESVEKIDDENLENSLGQFEKTSKIHYRKAQSQILKQREYRKLKLMIEFMGFFDLPTLQDTYIKVFYNYANEVGKDITICIRPSFLPHFSHIAPYYGRSEIINLGLNMELIKESDKFYDHKEVMRLCKIIKKKDMSSKTILSHQEYIIDNDKLGIIQYYSLQGSFFMNQYLRGLALYEYKNPLLEDNIKSMWKLINSAPKFDKSYILYRFIKTDDHIKNIKIGGTYLTPSFISTTRDPFYKQDEYKFGFILLKIKVPEGRTGVALCIESVSHFPSEEEIILSPLSMLRLDRKDENVPYYHTDKIARSKINTLYEFTFVDKKPIKLKSRPSFETETIVDFLEIDKTDSLTMEERISYFVTNYALPIYSYQAKIGEQIFTIVTEWYDSTDVYKDFYAARTDNGFYMYTFIENYIGFTVELGEDDDGSFMYINYYFRHSSTGKTNIDDRDLINFISKMAYYFEIKTVYVYSNYWSCGLHESIVDKEKIPGSQRRFYGGNFCVDFYNYFKYGVKRYKDLDIGTTELRPKFSFFQLDRLKKIDPMEILRKEDRDEIYQIYKRTYKGNNNIADFYVWMVDHNCSFVELLVKKIGRLYRGNNIRLNPFNNDYYELEASAYLYNRNLIDEMPVFTDTKPPEEFEKSKFKKLPKNDYRLQRDRNPRVPKRGSYLEI